MTRRTNAVEQADRQAAAVRLKSEGHDYRDIAGIMGCAVSTAFALVKAGLDRVPAEDVATLRQIEGQRMNAVVAAMWPAVESGDPRAATVVVAVSNRLAQLYGLDAPTRAEVSGAEPLTVMFSAALAPRPALELEE